MHVRFAAKVNMQFLLEKISKNQTGSSLFDRLEPAFILRRKHEKRKNGNKKSEIRTV